MPFPKDVFRGALGARAAIAVENPDVRLLADRTVRVAPREKIGLRDPVLSHCPGALVGLFG